MSTAVAELTDSLLRTKFGEDALTVVRSMQIRVAVTLREVTRNISHQLNPKKVSFPPSSNAERFRQILSHY